MDRRAFLLLGAGATAGAGLWAARLADDRRSPSSESASTSSNTSTPDRPPSYGDLLPPDALGVQLPAGFSARIVATSGEVVEGTGHTWHVAPDGGACFEHPAGGWVYVSNSEHLFGGAGALRFDADGEVVDAYTILSGTVANCAGGATPWGTWLSCEEHPDGQVWECDPLGNERAVARPAMGRFQHEAAACDPEREHVYLTEDTPTGRLRRFRPERRGDLSTGELEVAVVSDGVVTWTGSAEAGTPFDGGEGAWCADGHVWFTTKGDNRVWELDVRAEPNTITVLYDDDTASRPILTGVDNIVGAANGDLFVAEDGGSMELVRITRAGEVSAFLRLLDQPSSEITGPAFSPDGTRLYLSSQRGPVGTGSGVTYEVRGPFLA